MDINTDPSCGRATDLDIAFVSSLGLDVTMAPGGMVLVAAWLSDTNMAPGGSPDP